MRKIKLKICGMKEPDNLREIISLQPDIVGIIFYPGSSRYIGEKLINEFIGIPVKKAGVFVNEDEQKIKEISRLFELDIIQLHGNESPETCFRLKSTGKQIIKAFHISEAEDFKQLPAYEKWCDYFLFDTKTSGYGGSGRKFDWEILQYYYGEMPFLLSGGISPEDIPAILSVNHPRFAGIDVNSCFETAPGRKDVEKLRRFTEELKLNGLL
jgi:phosphoribosylanthranilate isomerase